MIIKSLSLENFRVFGGYHEFNLEPKTNSPIVLFGGLNGAGKTSILTAIRLALLGRLAFEHVSSNKDYIETLSGLIHQSKYTQTNTTSYVDLAFDFVREGKVAEYRITRSWNANQQDTLKISENGIDLPELNYEQGQSFLLEIVPPGIADLVFFDGEKIAELAEDNSGSTLKQAVKKLLGLDTVQRLQEDLRIYLKKADISAAKSELKSDLESLEVEKNQILTVGRKLRNEADHEYNSIVELNRLIQLAEQDLLSGGGAWASDREEQQKAVDQFISERQQVKTEIQRELDGTFALTLAPKTLKQLATHLAEEKSYLNRQRFSEQFEQFLPGLMKSKFNFSDEHLEIIANEAKNFTGKISKPQVEFGISEQQLGFLTSQINDQSKESAKKIHTLKQKLFYLDNQIDNASVNIQRAPEKEQLQKAFDSLRELETGKKEAVEIYRSKLTEAREYFFKAQQIAQRMLKLQNEMKRVFGDNDSAVRAMSVIEVLKLFSEQLASTRLTQLEKEFNVSYAKLARKEDLSISAKINPSSFDVTLVDELDKTIDRKAMSAGEKQIYAIAMLDALGKVSGKKLPVVIDTPLGRLDSKHRSKLVEHYFPEASEQVIILSTDTEIDHGFFDKLEDQVAHNYLIEFNSESQSSSVIEGYFWQDKEPAEAI